MITDFLTQTADLYFRRNTWESDGAQAEGTPSLRASSLACRVVQESPSTARIFFPVGTSVWEPEDTAVQIIVDGTKTYHLRRSVEGNALLGLEYGETSWPASFEGGHVEVVAEEDLIS